MTKISLGRKRAHGLVGVRPAASLARCDASPSTIRSWTRIETQKTTRVKSGDEIVESIYNELVELCFGGIVSASPVWGMRASSSRRNSSGRACRIISAARSRRILRPLVTPMVSMADGVSIMNASSVAMPCCFRSSCTLFRSVFSSNSSRDLIFAGSTPFKYLPRHAAMVTTRSAQ